ncbi:MAG: S-layer homology domain-containing protein [Peptoniphilus sp.]|uniref:S-layer homology domain-containing protein n=1 Tax=Peptoniphilus sp. TaxID=1971214 RepID=UPI00399A4C6A
MNKKIISLVLALVMVLGTFTSVFAETAKGATAKKEEVKKTETKKAEAGEKVEKVVGKDNKIQYIIDKKLVEGYEDGTYGLDKNIKRSEITRLLVLANGNEELAKQLQGSMKIYSDVDAKHWANGVITVGTTVPSDANGIAMLAGYPDGSFKPENDVTYAELAKMLVVLAKKDLTADMVKNAIWASSWMTWAQQLGILNDVTINDSNKAANRADAFTMIYNALYAMKEFKRVPANETRGIVSYLSNSKLVLNQDDKKEFTVTGETVVVDGINVRKNIVKVKSLNNLDLYKGSLVRVLTNSKNEVTHIIQLGNPDDLALSQNKEDNKAQKVLGNTVWNGVADNTVETYNYKNIETLKKVDTSKLSMGHAQVVLKDDKSNADRIKFFDAKQKELADLKINDKTEIYVANPYNNVMKQAKDIREALSDIGFQSYDSYKIPNVYAGYDNDGYEANVKYFNTHRSTAKVIVFNVVSRDKAVAKYRILESTDSKFMSLVENTDGEKFEINDVFNKAIFPLEYGRKFNVVSRAGDVVTTLIKHSDTKAYPIVKVVEVLDDDNIQVVDRFDNETVLYVGDADIFNAKQYKNLAKGDFLQFNGTDADKKDNTVDVLSIFDGKSAEIEKAFKDSASVLTVAPGIEGKTANGIVKEVKDSTVEILVKYTNWKSGYGDTVRTFAVDKADLAKLTKGMDVTFKVDTHKYENVDYAYNFRMNNGTNAPLTGKVTVNDIKVRINEANRMYNPAGVTCKNYLAAKAEVEAIAKEIAKLDLEDQKTFAANTVYDKALTDITTQVSAFETAKTNLDNEAAKIKDATIKDIAKADLTQAGILAAAKTEIEKAVATDKVTVTVELANAPTDNANYAAGAQLKVKVTVKSKEKTCLPVVEKTITGNIAN